MLILNFESDAIVVDSGTDRASEWGWNECGSATVSPTGALVATGATPKNVGSHQFYMPFRASTAYVGTGAVPAGDGATLIVAVSMTNQAPSSGYAILGTVATSGASGELGRIVLVADYPSGRLFGSIALSGDDIAAGSLFNDPFPQNAPGSPSYTISALSYEASTGDLHFYEGGVFQLAYQMEPSAGAAVSAGTHEFFVGAGDQPLFADVFGVYYFPFYMSDASGQIQQLTEHIQAEIAGCPQTGALSWSSATLRENWCSCPSLPPSWRLHQHRHLTPMMQSAGRWCGVEATSVRQELLEYVHVHNEVVPCRRSSRWSSDDPQLQERRAFDRLCHGPHVTMGLG